MRVELVQPASFLFRYLVWNSNGRPPDRILWGNLTQINFKMRGVIYIYFNSSSFIQLMNCISTNFNNIDVEKKQMQHLLMPLSAIPETASSKVGITWAINHTTCSVAGKRRKIVTLLLHYLNWIPNKHRCTTIFIDILLIWANKQQERTDNTVI